MSENPSLFRHVDRRARARSRARGGVVGAVSFPYSNQPRRRSYMAALIVLLMVCWAAVLYVVWVIVEWAT